jgi:hypothetical protein
VDVYSEGALAASPVLEAFNANSAYLKKQAVLSAFKNCANVTRACEIADIARVTFYEWLKKDPEFKQPMKPRVKRPSRFSKMRQLSVPRLADPTRC